ncbi:MAG TPA: hypothetical protein VLF60_04910 [Candidatus Saccharimonadales bacterium]|nr:hypothetical protein [Candidatus Saccharimonadales bacterium]
MSELPYYEQSDSAAEWHPYAAAQGSQGHIATEALTATNEGYTVEDIEDRIPVGAVVDEEHEDTIPEAVGIVEQSQPAPKQPKEEADALPDEETSWFDVLAAKITAETETEHPLPAVREEAPVSAPDTEVLEAVVGNLGKEDPSLAMDITLFDWYNNDLPEPYESAEASTLNLLLAQIVTERPPDFNKASEKPPEDDVPELEGPPLSETGRQMKEALKDPSQIPRMILETKPEGIWEAFQNVDYKKFLEDLPNKEASLKVLLDSLKFTWPEDVAPGQESEVARVLRFAEEIDAGLDDQGLSPYEKGQVKVRVFSKEKSLSKDEKQRLDAARRAFLLYISMPNRREKAFGAIAGFQKRQDELVSGHAASPFKSEPELPSPGCEERQWQVMGFTYHYLTRLGLQSDAEQRLVRHADVLFGLRHEARAAQAMKADPEGYIQGQRPEDEDPERLRDQAMLAVLRLRQQLLEGGDSDGPNAVLSFLDEPVKRAAKAYFVANPDKYLQGKESDEVRERAFRAELQRARITQSLILGTQSNAEAARKMLVSDAERIEKRLKAIEEYDKLIAGKAEPVQPQPIMTGAEIVLAPPHFLETALAGMVTAAFTQRARGIPDEDLEDMIKQIQRVQVAREEDPEAIERLRERLVQEEGKKAREELLPTRRILNVQGPGFPTEDRYGVLAAYVATHGTRDDTLLTLDTRELGRWVNPPIVTTAVETIAFVPHAGAQQVEAAFYEGLVQHKDAKDILRQMNPGGVTTVSFRHNPELAVELARQAQVSGDYVLEAFPAARLHFEILPDGQRQLVREPLGDGAFDVAIFRNEANGQISQYHTDLFEWIRENTGR